MKFFNKTGAIVLGICLGLGLFQPAWAQPAPQDRDVWTLQQCLEHAAKNNIALQQSRLQARTSRNNLNGAYGNALPSVNGNMSQSYTAGGRSVNPYDNTVVENETFRTSQLSLQASMNIFNGFANTNSIRQSRELLKAAEYQVQVRQNDINLQIVNNYVAILANREILANAQRQVASTQQQLDRTRRLVDAGSMPIANQYNLEAQVATEELNVINAENSVAQSKLALQQLLQLAVKPGFEVVTPANLPEPTPVAESAQDIYGTAVGIMPEIKNAQTQAKAAEYARLVAIGRAAPSLTASAGLFSNYSSLAKKRSMVSGSAISVPFGYYSDLNGAKIPVFVDQPVYQTQDFGFFDQIDNNLRRGLTFSLAIPIFSQLQNRNAIGNAVVNQENARLQQRLEEQNLRQKIEQAWQDMRAASKRYGAAQKQVASLQESFRATEKRFQAGAVNNLDFNLAKNNLNNAEADLIRARYEYLFRSKILDFYQGRPLSF